MCNRYLVRVHHPELYGVDIELLADDIEEAATMALAECPADTYLERIYPLEIDVLEPGEAPGGTLASARILSRERMAMPIKDRESEHGEPLSR